MITHETYGDHLDRPAGNADRILAACLLATALACLAVLLLLVSSGTRDARAYSAAVRVGEPALEAWGWRSDMPYRRDVSWVPDVNAHMKDHPLPGRGPLGAYDPSTGEIWLRESGPRDRLLGQDPALAYLHEYGHALTDDWCRREYGSIRGPFAFRALCDATPTGRVPLLFPVSMRPLREEWLAGRDPAGFYGQVSTADFGEYMAESFARFVKDYYDVPPRTRAFLEGLGGKRPPVGMSPGLAEQDPGLAGALRSGGASVTP